MHKALGHLPTRTERLSPGREQKKAVLGGEAIHPKLLAPRPLPLDHAIALDRPEHNLPVRRPKQSALSRCSPIEPIRKKRRAPPPIAHGLSASVRQWFAQSYNALSARASERARLRPARIQRAGQAPGEPAPVLGKRHARVGVGDFSQRADVRCGFMLLVNPRPETATLIWGGEDAELHRLARQPQSASTAMGASGRLAAAAMRSRAKLPTSASKGATSSGSTIMLLAISRHGFRVLGLAYLLRCHWRTRQRELIFPGPRG